MGQRPRYATDLGQGRKKGVELTLSDPVMDFTVSAFSKYCNSVMLDIKGAERMSKAHVHPAVAVVDWE